MLIKKMEMMQWILLSRVHITSTNKSYLNWEWVRKFTFS